MTNRTSRIGDLLRKLADFRAALETEDCKEIQLAEQLLSTTKEKFSPDSLETADALNRLAVFCTAAGREGEAEEYLNHSLRIRRTKLGEDNLAFATSLNNLGKLYCQKGRYDQAELLLHRALGLRKERLGENHLAVAITLSNLGELYCKRARYDQAENCWKLSLKIMSTTLGEDNLAVAITLNNLGELYYKTGRYEETENFLRHSLEIMEKFRSSTPDFTTRADGLAGKSVTCSWGETKSPQAVPLGLATAAAKADLSSLPGDYARKGQNEIGHSSPAFWNIWFEDCETGKRSEMLEAEKIYDCVLDLSRPAYFENYSAPVSQSVGCRIAEAKQRGCQMLCFIIRPILHGGLLCFCNNQQASIKLKIDLTKLQNGEDSDGKKIN